MLVALLIGPKQLDNIFPVYRTDLPKRWAVNWKESNYASQFARRWFQLALSDFDNAERQFLRETGTSLLLNVDETAKLATVEQSGEVAEQAGNLRGAFDTYVAAIASLPLGASGEAEESLRERIVKLAARLNPRPSLPEDANRHFAYGLAAIDEGKKSGDSSNLDEAIDELHQAVRIAPWWPDAYFNLGIVLEMRERYGDATRNLKLYLLAAPNSPDAAAVQQQIYQLEYKAGKR
jgi:tetratricopeptide (TPR) repeat protein